MNDKPQDPAASPGTEGVPRPGRRRGPQGPRLKKQASPHARRLAACVLEVLGGGRTPVQAARELGLSVPSYYLLEGRAVQGLVAACEPVPKGRVRSEQSELGKARREAERLKSECTRYAALVRIAQRTIGLSAVPPPKPKPGGKGHKPRRPAVRALKAVARLRENLPQLASPPAP